MGNHLHIWKPILNYFVTATGTDIGKTYVSALLARQWRDEGKSIQALKPVLSGFTAENLAESDSAQLLDALNIPVTPAAFEAITPWHFSAPLSPDMAAIREDRRINLAEIIAFCEDQAEKAEITLVEGVGGVMVPLNEKSLVLDWMMALNWPVILVAGTYLGTISHSLSALRVLKDSGLGVAALILSESETSPVAISETVATLRNFISDMPILPLAHGQKILDLKTLSV